MATHEQVKHAVATALVEMRRDPALHGQWLTAGEVAKRSSVPVGHVRKVLREDFGLKFGTGDTFGWTREQYDAIEAHTLMPVARAAAVNSQVFNINTNHGHVVAGDNHESTDNTVSNHGSNNQIAAGGDVTGNLNITVTYEQVLNQLVRDVEASDLPAEKKKGVIDAVKALLKEGAVQSMKLAVGELVKAAYTHSGGVAALAEQAGKML